MIYYPKNRLSERALVPRGSDNRCSIVIEKFKMEETINRQERWGEITEEERAQVNENLLEERREQNVQRGL